MLFLLLSSLVYADDIDEKRIVVLQSDNYKEYSTPAKVFEKLLKTKTKTTIYSIHGKKRVAEDIADELREDPPDLIFALGAKAAWTAKNKLPDIPMLYAQVRNPKRYGIKGENVVGISIEPPADLTISQFQLFVPKAKNIVFFVNKDNTSPIIQNAESTAKNYGLNPIKIKVNSTRDLRKALTKLPPETDVIWLLPDPVVITPDNFYHINNTAHRGMIPTLASSYHLAKAGSLLSISPNYEVLGEQAVQIAKKILKGETSLFGKEFQPEDVYVALNLNTQKNIQLEIAEHNLDFVNKIISSE